MKLRGSIFLRRSAVLFFICGFISCNGGGGGESAADSANNWVIHWNEIAVDTSGIDHLRDGQHLQQGGPVRAARAMAIVHIAMADAVAAIYGTFHAYLPTQPAVAGTSAKAAVSQAAHDTLVALFPAQTDRLDSSLQESLDDVPAGVDKDNGKALGKKAAADILAVRTSDGSELSEPIAPVNYTPKQDPGKWRPDPINPGQTALGANWNKVIPFVMSSAAQFRVTPPPALSSAAYALAYDEAKRLGGDGVSTPTERTGDQTSIGLFWAYDGTPSLCAPPRLYNQIARQLAIDHNLSVDQEARLFALINVAMADAGIAIWESKYFYELWRPIAGIRESDQGTGPTGLGDGNSSTQGDPSWTPLGAPATNLNGPNFTPPFPAYPSGHAGFGGALFEVFRNFFGSDNVPFTFVSDELNGVTIDPSTGAPRPLAPRSFATFSQAEEENGQSRIYLGIHWQFDKTEGIAQGRKVGDLVFENTFTPVQ